MSAVRSIQQADMHMHSTSSDGKLAPSDVAARAAEAGAGLISLTDHDTTAGLQEARSQALNAGIAFVNGVEISSRQEVEVHLLAYGFDAESAVLTELLESQQEARTARGHRFVEVLTEHGALPQRAVLDISSDTSLARPHIADLLIEFEAVQSRSEAFDRYLTPGTPTFVPKPLPRGADVIEAVHEAGGIVSLAHPGHAVPHRVVLALISHGLDAVEVVHPAHDEMLIDYYTRLAERHGLLKTGGSDYHGDGQRQRMDVGAIGFRPDQSLIERLRTLPGA